MLPNQPWTAPPGSAALAGSLVSGRSQCVWETLAAKDAGKLPPGFSWTLPQVPFFFFPLF